MLLAGSLAFRCGFGLFATTASKRRVLELSKSSLASQKRNSIDLVALDNMIRSCALQNTQTPVNDAVYPAIHNSPFLLAKYPNQLNRTVQSILGGLPDVVDIEYLSTLPMDDPRRRLLPSIQDPGPERRAELIENLQAIDAERGDAAKNESTLSVYQKLSREGFDTDLVRMLEKAAGEETLRRERAEFTEYMKEGWNSLFGTEELTEFVHKCFEKRETGLVCAHPSLSVWFPYYKKGQPPTNYSLTELCDMRGVKAYRRNYINIAFEYLIYPAIEKLPLIAEKYPDPADRTPHKLLGGLGNIVSIEYMQSLEPHDPRRLFLDTIKPLSKKRQEELEMNVVLLDQAITERDKAKPGEFSLRMVVLELVRDTLEENYLTTLIYAKRAELHRNYAKNGGAEPNNPENDAYRQMLADATAYFAEEDVPEL